MKKTPKLNAAQKQLVKSFRNEITKRTRQNAQVPMPANDMLGGIFGGMMAGQAPLSSFYGLAYDANYTPISLNRILLSYTYFTHGPIQTAIDQPIDDAFRGGLDLKCDELDAEDLKRFSDYMNRHVIPRVKDGMRWASLFGGAGLILNTAEDPETPFNPDTITEGDLFKIIAADRWELTYNFTTEKIECPYNYYGQKLHKSRVLKLEGKEAPSFIRRRLQGWGMSVVERMIRPAQAFLKNEDLIYELVDEAKIDVLKIQGFNNQHLSGLAANMTADFIKLAALTKNFHNMLAIDKEDDYDQKQISFSGLPEILNQNRISMASAIRMPVTKLFGLSAAGFNSGEDDIENYNAMVESDIRGEAREILLKLIPIAARLVFGYAPDISFEFKPLRILSTEQEETVKTNKFNRLSALYNQGILTPQEYCEALKKDQIFIMDTEVSKGIRDPEPPMASSSVDIPQDSAREEAPKKNSRRNAVERFLYKLARA